MEVIILCIALVSVTFIELRYKYKLKRCRNWNNGFHKGYEESLKVASLMAEKANKEICKEFKAQFKFVKNEMPPWGVVEVSEGSHPLNFTTTKFYGETYSISFYLEPNRDGYVTIHNEELVK